MKYFPLQQAVVLSVSGAQAQRYLQVRLTNDMKILSSQRAMQAAALSPQGRTEALFTVLAVAENSFLLFADGGEPQAVLESLKRFVVTERIDFKNDSQEFAVFHILPSHEKEDMGALLPPAPTHAQEFSRITTASALFISRRRSADWGWDVLVSKAHCSAFVDKLRAKEAVQVSEQDQLLLRLRAGIPIFPIEINSEHIFAEAALTQAISFTKGCYTGQEVIAKIDALGKPPRLLTRLKLSTPIGVSPGEPVIGVSEQRPIGEVLSCAVDHENNATWIFASVRSSIDLASTKISIGENEATLVACGPAPAKAG